MNIHRKRQGFTLPEILVAVAIFSVLSFITVRLFTGALRTAKRGYQSIEAYEIGRSALKVLERDLSSAYAARGRGDYYTFYGTPIGMSFITLSNDVDSGNVVRVTYAISATGRGRKEVVTGDDDALMTYSLIRYVERGVEDLDSFNLGIWNWPPESGLLSYNPLGLSPEDESGMGQIWDELYYLVDEFILPELESEGFDIDADENQLHVEQYIADHELFKAKKRELWIRMIAGDPDLPNIWQSWDAAAVDGNDFKEQADYILAENIILLDANNQIRKRGFSEGTIVNSLLSPLLSLFGEYVEDDIANYVHAGDDFPEGLRPLFQYGMVPPLDQSFVAWQNWGPNALNGGQTLSRIPEVVTAIFTTLMGSPYPGVPDTIETFTQDYDLKSGYARSGLKDLTGL